MCPSSKRFKNSTNLFKLNEHIHLGQKNKKEHIHQFLDL